MRDTRYHGGFDHPVRSFLIGVSLLALLFGGFVVGIEAGARPSSAGLRTITLRDQRLRVVTVQQPVVRTTVGGATIVSVLGPDGDAAVVRDGDRTLVGYLPHGRRGQTVASSAFQQSGTIYVPEPTTVTETVTETVIETITDTSSDGGAGSDATASP